MPVIVAALGYFVDIYDLLLFGIVRDPSLKSLGLNPAMDSTGGSILDWQMGGLLLGGILWGILGDKRGRLSVLFGSILLYSVANILCGFLPYFPQDKETLIFSYTALRFIAGIGLAGELGAGITLVSESLPKELRALGTSLVAGFGLFGAVVANFTVNLSGDAWHVAYYIGGGMGIGLLLLRIGVAESGIFKEIAHNATVKRGSFLSFFTNWNRFVRYMKCIGIGLPTWFCIGVLAMGAGEFAKTMHINGVKNGDAIMWGYIGISAGDFFSGFLSHMLASRKKAILIMMLFTSISVVWLLFGGIKSAEMYYFLCCWFGFGTGYWAMFVTVGAEQFGTNIRSTAATTIPNVVRGTVILMNNGVVWLASQSMTNNLIWGGAIVGIVCFAIGIYSTLTISETHNKDLDFVE